MPGKGYKVLSVKEEVVVKIQQRAKEEEVSISKLLDNLLESSTDTVSIGSNNTVSSTDTVLETIRETIREELKSSKYTAPKEEEGEEKINDKYAHFKTYTLPEKKKTSPARPF